MLSTTNYYTTLIYQLLQSAFGIKRFGGTTFKSHRNDNNLITKYSCVRNKQQYNMSNVPTQNVNKNNRKKILSCKQNRSEFSEFTLSQYFTETSLFFPRGFFRLLVSTYIFELPKGGRVS